MGAAQTQTRELANGGGSAGEVEKPEREWAGGGHEGVGFCLSTSTQESSQVVTPQIS